MNETLRFKGWTCRLVWGVYGNGRRALQLVAAHDQPAAEDGDEIYAGEPIATATVNLPEAALADDETCIKDYAENAGMLDALVAAGIVTPTGLSIESGYVRIPVCRWLVTEQDIARMEGRVP